jgi:hypothetical protein
MAKRHVIDIDGMKHGPVGSGADCTCEIDDSIQRGEMKCGRRCERCTTGVVHWQPVYGGYVSRCDACDIVDGFMGFPETQKFNLEYTLEEDRDCLFIAQLRESGLSPQSIESVIQVMNAVCLDCFDSPKRCFCTRDE